ncbi:MAG: nitroreductase family protein [Fischerella sp.]|jgi:nitroreductase|uniref:nitroreductase family protein n=1 Tax=Fischerella sp. TaxID=1191 RepID=UPI00183FA13C|nr:nitroreductase family protein [Fischerella sp.]NWF59173.1 nitroreductase family protein [Fischerella sp.]
MNPITQELNLQAQPLDVPSAIFQRRSIKTFKPDPIAPELLRQLVELTVAAPSSFNIQDWRIILVQDEAQKVALSEAAWNQKQIIQAPVTFVFAADAMGGEKDLTPIYEQGLQTGAWPEGTVNYFKTAIPQFQSGLGNKRREYAIKDAMIAATHLVLAAESLGLSTCFMNGWIEDKVKAVIGATDDPNLAIAVLVPVGYAAEPRLNPGRLPFSHNVFVDRVGNPYQD